MYTDFKQVYCGLSAEKPTSHHLCMWYATLADNRHAYVFMLRRINHGMKKLIHMEYDETNIIAESAPKQLLPKE